MDLSQILAWAVAHPEHAVVAAGAGSSRCTVSGSMSKQRPDWRAPSASTTVSGSAQNTACAAKWRCAAASPTEPDQRA